MDPHSATEASGHSHGHGVMFCNGEPLLTEGGSWIGHFIPGMVFFVWGLHWMQGVFRMYFQSRRIKGAEYRAATAHSLWIFPAYLESAAKASLPLIAISLELYFAHRGGFRTMICPAGTERAGHFFGPHMGNWQHAAMYPAFILAGLVDLVGYEVDLPAGTQQIFLFLAFVCETLLMALHKKHTPLDIAVHEVLMYSMAATAAFVLLEALQPRSFLIGCGRAASALLQGCWFFMACRIMFEGRPAWDEAGGADMGPAMMVPVFFVMTLVGVLAAMLVAFLLFNAYYKIKDAQSAQYERAASMEDGSASAFAAGSAVPLSTFASSGVSSNPGGTSCCQV